MSQKNRRTRAAADSFDAAPAKKTLADRAKQFDELAKLHEDNKGHLKRLKDEVAADTDRSMIYLHKIHGPGHKLSEQYANAPIQRSHPDRLAIQKKAVFEANGVLGKTTHKKVQEIQDRKAKQNEYKRKLVNVYGKASKKAAKESSRGTPRSNRPEASEQGDQGTDDVDEE